MKFLLPYSLVSIALLSFFGACGMYENEETRTVSLCRIELIKDGKFSTIAEYHTPDINDLVELCLEKDKRIKIHKITSDVEFSLSAIALVLKKYQDAQSPILDILIKRPDGKVSRLLNYDYAFDVLNQLRMLSDKTKKKPAIILGTNDGQILIQITHTHDKIEHGKLCDELFVNDTFDILDDDSTINDGEIWSDDDEKSPKRKKLEHPEKK